MFQESTSVPMPIGMNFQPHSHPDCMTPNIHEQHEELLEIPLDRINPDTLLNMVNEFVTREWADLCDSGCTLEEKVEQVMLLLKNKKDSVTFDRTTETWNIVERR